MTIHRLISPLFFVPLFILSLAGCVGMRPLHSTPPFKKIVLATPFDGDGFMFHLNMPAGDYLPVYEEGTAYFYQAPGQLAIRTIATDYVDGGFYIDGVTKKL